jgi:hypothetical protein
VAPPEIRLTRRLLLALGLLQGEVLGSGSAEALSLRRRRAQHLHLGLRVQERELLLVHVDVGAVDIEAERVRLLRRAGIVLGRVDRQRPLR